MRHELLESWRPGRDGAWDRSAATHLARRAGFGPQPGEVELALEKGFETSLNELFAPRGHDPQLLASIEPLLATGSIETLQAWWLALMLDGGDPLRERVASMWHNHFATSFAKVADVRLMHAQNRLFRERGLGDFRELTAAVAKDPAMLVWLDGDDNRVGHPNENFAREVMELFALGRGNYSEHDIREAARAFTGWGTEGRSFAFRADLHDRGDKELFGERGAFDGERALELVLAQPACPRHVARRLIAEFVSIEVEPAVVDALASVLVASNWSIELTLRRLLGSRLFFSNEARRSRIAAPVELVAISVRALGARVAPAEAAQAAARMGQALFKPPTVKGWDGGRAWINASAWLARHNSLADLAASKGTVHVDLAAAFGAPKTIDEVPQRAVDVLLGAGASRDYLAELRDVAAHAGSLQAALVDVATAILTSPEYHFT
jgi:uncharacterized protein (DUF1800 family)